MQKRRNDMRGKHGRGAKKVRGSGPRNPERTSASILAAAVKEFTRTATAAPASIRLPRVPAPTSG